MTTISKFYLHDAATPNIGTMPGAGTAFALTGTVTIDVESTGARTARTADGTIGTANPDIESTATALATINAQWIAHRRFITPPLASQAIPSGTWTLSYAGAESNLNHNQNIRLNVAKWNATTGSFTGTSTSASNGNEPASAGAETIDSSVGTDLLTGALGNGDYLVFEILSNYTQAMATGYTDTFAYDGTTEASTTTCASFVTPPAALTLFAPAKSLVPETRRVSRNSNLRRCVGKAWDKRPSGIFVPNKDILVPA